MPAKLVVVEENRMFGNICGLQPSCHLACMEGIAVPVSVTGDDHRGGIGHALANLMIGRIFYEGCEIVRVVHRAELIFPNMRIVKKVVPQHVQHRNHTKAARNRSGRCVSGGAYE